ncbi:urease accessory protein UreD [Tahibacter caeni]|uniref:urease accessory protein UreD n=1 Tax=Tahibacter caeni TaxID=1453545 RepID=UPI0021498556|nr:urease accessory protein UreD [Tahibacter caeni]
MIPRPDEVMPTDATSDAAVASPAPPWPACLQLRFVGDGGRTRLAEARHTGPLRLQRLLHPRGDACQGLLLHPPGGIAGGDSLDVAVHLHAGSEVLLSTPGATKWYRSAGPEAQQSIRLQVDAGATLEWLPQESILFSGADAIQQLELDLAPGARMLGWDIVQLGRIAAGERWNQGRLRQSLSVRRAGQPVWHEQADLRADDALLHSPVGLAGRAVFATLWSAAPALEGAPDAALEQVRETLALTGLQSTAGSSQSSLCAAATWLPAPASLLLVRVLGHDAEAVRGQLERAWAALRPLVSGRPARRPRIWNT